MMTGLSMSDDDPKIAEFAVPESRLIARSPDAAQRRRAQ